MGYFLLSYQINKKGDTMQRLYVTPELLNEAETALDNAYINFDLDDGDRIIVEDDDLDDAITTLENAEIDYDEI